MSQESASETTAEEQAPLNDGDTVGAEKADRIMSVINQLYQDRNFNALLLLSHLPSSEEKYAGFHDLADKIGMNAVETGMQDLIRSRLVAEGDATLPRGVTASPPPVGYAAHPEVEQIAKNAIRILESDPPYMLFVQSPCKALPMSQKQKYPNLAGPDTPISRQIGGMR